MVLGCQYLVYFVNCFVYFITKTALYFLINYYSIFVTFEILLPARVLFERSAWHFIWTGFVSRGTRRIDYEDGILETSKKQFNQTKWNLYYLETINQMEVVFMF